MKTRAEMNRLHLPGYATFYRPRQLRRKTRVLIDRVLAVNILDICPTWTSPKVLRRRVRAFSYALLNSPSILFRVASTKSS